MAKYRNTGPGPDYVPGEDGPLIVHPGDVWEFPEGPVLGNWERIGDDSSEKPSEASEGNLLAPHQDDAENPPTDAPGPSSTPEA